MAREQGLGGRFAVRFSIIVLILIVAGLSAISFMVLRPMETAARRNMAEIRSTVVQQIEELTGRKLEYGSMSPSFFGTLDIRNIRFLRADRSPVLTISRLRLSFSLWNLLRGNFD